jgi:hypothetical protein
MPWDTPSPTPSPSYSPTPTPSERGGKLSTAAEAAIATGAIIAGLAGIGGWIFVRRKNRRLKALRAKPQGTRSGSGGEVLARSAGAFRGAAVTRRRDEGAGAGAGEEALPRHSEDVAPPPYSREEPGKV